MANLKAPKLSSKKSEAFQDLYKILVEAGLDNVSPEEGHTVIRVFLDNEASWSIVFGIDGTWRLE